MPTYEYLCEGGHEFEVVQKITDDPLTECTESVTVGIDFANKQARKEPCGAACKRLISKTSFTLKGKGWEKDGYTGETK